MVSSVEQREIFCFYRLRINLPKTFFDKFGSADLVSSV